MIVGVDGWNVRGGGVLTHLPNFLASADPKAAGISKMIVWGSPILLDRLPERPWLEARGSKWLGLPLPGRVIWHELLLPPQLRSECDVVWCPTGLPPRRHVATTVSMLRTSLPFDRAQLARYGWFKRARFQLLGHSLIRSLRRADGLLFISQFGRSLVQDSVSVPLQEVVHHGVERRFQSEPQPQRPLSEYSRSRPFRFLYVSHVHPYKNHAHLARAVSLARRAGLPVALDCVGLPRSRAATEEFEQTIARLDPEGEFLRYLGGRPFDEVHESYLQADAFAFPSSCENLPNTLIEAMSAGLPIASSDRGPMPEMLQDGGLYFDPEDDVDIARALTTLAESVELRRRLVERSRKLVEGVSWERCARQTLDFISRVAFADRAKRKSPAAERLRGLGYSPGGGKRNSR